MSDAADAPPPLTVYEATKTGIPPLRVYFRDFWARRPLLWHLARTKLKGDHYDTVLGQVWLILNPLLLAMVYLFVRAILRPMGTGEAQLALIDHLIMGVFFFRFASECLGANAKSILQNRQMVLNTGFPRLIFPISTVVQDFMEFVPTLGVYFLVHAYLDQPFTSALIYLPYIVFMMVVLNVGLTLFCAPVPVLWPDGAAVMPYLQRVWLYVTPVLFTVAEIPPGLVKYMWLNPLFPFFAALEEIFDGYAPSPSYLLQASAWALGSLVVGLPVFLVKERRFAARL